ncbi:hypothetical protein HMPREF9466_01243 [Fusobacterium necrophorum subsp. funduliforme 1_1_36S]|nr:hypothetical protein HMPREF9466_01243 [Fusobacterium necrophorum subsp. funduliforme 1_1_36S]
MNYTMEINGDKNEKKASMRRKVDAFLKITCAIAQNDV